MRQGFESCIKTMKIVGMQEVWPHGTNVEKLTSWQFNWDGFLQQSIGGLQRYVYIRWTLIRYVERVEM